MRTRTLRPIGLATALMLAACGEESTGPLPVASVDVSPTQVTLVAGQTTSLAAVARDANGTALPDRTITWEAGNSAFATVTSSGAVTGVAEGSTQVSASAEGVSGSANVTVLPPPVATVQVEPTQLSLLPGETAQLTATARDEEGVVVGSAAFTWLSDDVSVATVDATGLVTSVTPGSALIYATVGGRSAFSAVGVDDPDAPRVTSVDPAELVEGQPATLGGANFSDVPAENVVTVDGVQATVTDATATSLDIVVPTLACRPRHLADIVVTVAGRTGTSSHPVTPASSLALAAGEMLLLREPTEYCLQFGENAADEEYLVGVQSNAYNPATLTPILVAGERDAAAPAPTLAPRPSAAPTRVAADPLDDPAVARFAEWRAREAEVMAREIDQARALQGAQPALAPQLIDPPIPGDVTVGTPVTLRYPDLDFANTCTNYVEIDGTVEYVTSSGIWVSDDDNPASGYTDFDYEILGDQFEDVIYPTQSGYFGAPADEDGNGRIVIVVTKEVNDDGIGGIVPSANLFSRAQCAGSNEGEYFFMIAPDPAGEYAVGTLSVLGARNLSPAILGHELVHNIHLSRRDAAGLSFWDSWMHEGQATLGEEILGHELTSRGPGMNYGWLDIRDDSPGFRPYYDAFAALFRYYGWSGDGNPTISTDEGSTKRPNAPEGCTFLDTPSGNNAGVCADRGLLVYGVTWSFLRWLTDQYSGDFASEAAMHQAWIDGPATGFASLETLVGEDIEVLLAGWAASLYLDDRPEAVGLDPYLTLPSWDLYDIESNLAPEAHLLPRVEAFDDFSHTVSVRAGSTAYFLVSGADRPSTAVKVRASGGGFLSPTIQLWVVRVR